MLTATLMAACAAARELSSDVINGTNLVYMLQLLMAYIIYNFNSSNKTISVEYFAYKSFEDNRYHHYQW